MANVEKIIIAKRRRHTVARSNFGFGYLRDRWNETVEKAFANLPVRCLLSHPTRMIQLYCCSFERGDKIQCEGGLGVSKQFSDAPAMTSASSNFQFKYSQTHAPFSNPSVVQQSWDFRFSTRPDYERFFSAGTVHRWF